jgi:hypothetical protein
LTASLRQDTQKLVSGKRQHEKDKLENCLSGFPSLSKRLQQITEQGMQLLRYGNTGCGVFKGGIQNKKGFWLRINLLKFFFLILRIGVVERCQKVPKFDFQSQFSMANIIGIFLVFFIEEYEVMSRVLVIDIF